MIKSIFKDQKSQVIIAILLAVLIGIIFHDNEELVSTVFTPLGNVFLNLIKCFMIPLIFFSIIIGIVNLESADKLKKIGLKIILWFSITTVIASFIGIIIGKIIPLNVDGLNLDMENEISVDLEKMNIISTLFSFIPDNIINSFSSTNLIQIIFLSVVLGVALLKNKEKFSNVIDLCNEINEIFKLIMSAILKSIPIGIFALLSPVIINNNISIILSLGKVIIAYILACIVHIGIVYIPMIKFGKRIKIIEFFKIILPTMVFAFSSASSLATLGSTMESAKNLKIKDEISKFTIPLGATINMDGTAIFLSIISIFIASIYGIELSVAKLLLLVIVTVFTSIGTPGIPGASLIIIAVTLNSLGLPLSGLGLIAGIDVLLEMFGTAMNVCGDLVCANYIDKVYENNN